MFVAVLFVCYTDTLNDSVQCGMVANRGVWPSRETCESVLVELKTKMYDAFENRNDATIEIDGQCFKFDEVA